MINYSEDFKERTEKLFPDDEEIHQLLETGNPRLLYLLEKHLNEERVSKENILAATSLRELKDKVKREEKIGELCREASEFL